MRVWGEPICVVCTAWSAAAVAAAPTASQRHFALPRGPVAITIPEFGRQADIQILMPEEATRGRSTNKVHGTMPVAKALRRLLSGTGIAIVHTDGHTIVLAATPVATRKTSSSKPQQVLLSSPASVSKPLAEIVVTAQRRLEDMQQVPIAIAAIGADMAARAGITRTTDLPMLVPGLLYTEGVGLGIPYIRGVGSTANGPGAENGVALYIDDVYQGSKAAAIKGLADLAHIEILKGPQGPLFGRNANGGLIQIKTLEPKESFDGFLRLGYGSYATTEASLYITGPLGGSAVASLSAFARNQRDGWGHNLPTGNSVNRSDERGLRAKLNFSLGDATRIRIGADWSLLDSSIGSAYRPVDGTLPAHGTPFTAGRYDTVATVDPIAFSRTGGASVRVERTIGSATLNIISAYRYAAWRLFLDQDWQPPDRLAVHGRVHENAYSQEVRIAGPAGGRIELQGGLYLYLTNGRQSLAFTGANLAPLSATAIVGAQSTRSYALYTQTRRRIDTDTYLTLGGRYTLESRRLTGHHMQANAPGEASTSPLTDRRSKTGAPTWRIALDRKLTKDALVYASYDRGSKSGAFNPGNLDGPELRPEQIDALQAGIKSEWLDDRVRINFAAFRYAWRDIQLQTNRNGVPLISNAAAARLEGVDLDMEAQVTRKLRLSAAVEWLHARFTDYPDAPGVSPSPYGGNSLTLIDATGNRLPFSPKLTASLGVTQDIAAWSGTLQASATARYTTRYFTEPHNLLVQPGYSVINARLQWQSGDDRLRVALWGNNLTNSFYAVALTAQPAGSVISAAEPRTFGMAVEVRF